MAYYVILEITETLNNGRTLHKQYKRRIQVDEYDLQDLNGIEDMFSSKEDPYIHLPKCEAIVINVFETPDPKEE